MAYLRQAGLGAYDPVGDWTWEYWPPPYDFLAPADSRSIAPISSAGLGGCGCGGSCGGCGGHSHGMGLFDSGLDVSGWGLPEFAIVGAGALVLVNFLSSGRAKPARRQVAAAQARRRSKSLARRAAF